MPFVATRIRLVTWLIPNNLSCWLAKRIGIRDYGLRLVTFTGLASLTRISVRGTFPNLGISSLTPKNILVNLATNKIILFVICDLPMRSSVFLCSFVRTTFFPLLMMLRESQYTGLYRLGRSFYCVTSLYVFYVTILFIRLFLVLRSIMCLLYFTVYYYYLNCLSVGFLKLLRRCK